MFRKLKDFYGRFCQVREEGRYGKGSSVFSDLWGQVKGKMPTAPKIDIAAKAPLLGMLARSKLLWTAVIAAISVESVIAGVATVGAAAASFFAFEYYRCRKSR